MEQTQLDSAMLPQPIDGNEAHGQTANVIFSITAADYNPNAPRMHRFDGSPIKLESFTKVSREEAAAHALAALTSPGEGTLIDIRGGADYAEFTVDVSGNRMLVSAGDVFELDTENCIATIRRHPENQANHSRTDVINWQVARCSYTDPRAKRKSEPTME